MNTKQDWPLIGAAAAALFLLGMIGAVAGKGRLHLEDPWKTPIDMGPVNGGDVDCTPEALAKLGMEDLLRLARRQAEMAKEVIREGKGLPPSEADAKRFEAEPSFACADRAYDGALKQAQGLGPKDARYIDLINEIAYYYYQDRNIPDRALAHFIMLTQVRQAGQGPTSPELALDFNKLGNVYAFMVKNVEAEQNFRRALDIVIQTPPGDPKYKDIIKNDFAVFLRRLGRNAEADEIMKK